jgi:hypothetical protein
VIVHVNLHLLSIKLTHVFKRKVFEVTTIFFNEIPCTPQVVTEIGPPEDPQLGGHSYFTTVKGATQEQEAIPRMVYHYYLPKVCEPRQLIGTASVDFLY